jgi:hypothetical protein
MVNVRSFQVCMCLNNLLFFILSCYIWRIEKHQEYYIIVADVVDKQASNFKAMQEF